MTGVRVAAVLTVHNRRALTLACLRSLAAQRVPDGTLEVFLVDDGSTDGTSDAVRREHPDVRLIPGDGQLYWTGGMRRALATAMADDYDHYLWMNDDTVLLDDGVVARLLETERGLRDRGRAPVVVVGTTRHPETGEPTYGGQVRLSRWRRVEWTLVPPGDEPRRSETMNGNIVLVPRAVVERVGNIDPAYVQQMGDLDYGLRAAAAGCEIWVAPGTLGECASHPARRTDQQPLRRELRRLWSVKELAPGPWRVFTRRWAGSLWFLFWLSPYLRRSIGLVLQRLHVRGTVSGVR